MVAMVVICVCVQSYNARILTFICIKDALKLNPYLDTQSIEKKRWILYQMTECDFLFEGHYYVFIVHAQTWHI